MIMTKNATNFITPITFETLTGQKCMVDTFDRDFKFEVTHIETAKAADLILIAPATANVIAKMAHGIADDMLTTVVLAARCPKLVSPAMNTGMLENPITQDNLKTLEKYGFGIIPSESGVLACKDKGSGRLPKEEVLLDYIYRELARPKDMQGLRVTVTAGPTQESLDPVRYLTNHSTGRMGYAIAREAMLRGAEVTLISGPVSLAPPPFVKVVPVVTAQDMFEAVAARLNDTDILIKAAAVADYRPAHVAEDKIKKTDAGDLDQLALERTQDILGWVAQHRHEGLYVCGFSMETQNMLENSAAKLEKKLRKNEFTLEDFLDQMGEVQKMGGIGKMLEMMPGMKSKSVSDDEIEKSEKEFRQMEAIIYSMTLEERRNPSLLNASRRKRISAGSGQPVSKINGLIKKYEDAKKLMKQFSNPNFMKKNKRFKGLF